MFIAIRKRLEQREEGFTLIELLVVVIIIGILAAIAVPTFLNQRVKAGNSAAQADLRNAAIAQESFFTDDGVGGSGAYAADADLKNATKGAFKGSDTVTLTVLSPTTSTGNTYCMVAKHAQSNNYWTLSNTNGSAVDAGTTAPTAC